MLACSPTGSTSGPLAPTAHTREDLRRSLVTLGPELFGRALRMSRSVATAEDLVQDTVERALRFESSYQPGTNLRAWMQQVLFSVFVTRCRRLRRERRALESLTTDPCAWTHSESGPAMTALSPRVERALAELPRPFGDVVRLVDLDERSYKDAAAMLGVPVGTVMSRLFRGRRLLAESLREVSFEALAEAA